MSDDAFDVYFEISSEFPILTIGEKSGFEPFVTHSESSDFVNSLFEDSLLRPSEPFAVGLSCGDVLWYEPEAVLPLVIDLFESDEVGF